mmetsp:Transcript_15915/g.35093  ORF Transcript_15915/g.35093 Transcript_15915/m.35093 type:complete len:205 (-) Transcript_15915:1960-2574(-)
MFCGGPGGPPMLCCGGPPICCPGCPGGGAPGGPCAPPDSQNCTKSAYENVPPWKLAGSSTRCQKNRLSSPASPSRTTTTRGTSRSGHPSSRSAETIEFRRVATSLPPVRRRICPMSAPSSELIPKSDVRRDGSDDRPTHRNVSRPLSRRNTPPLVSRSTVRLTAPGSSIRSGPATPSSSSPSDGAPLDGRPALGGMSCTANMRG